MAKRKSLSVGIDDESNWRTESDLSTITEADKIKADPKRMAAVAALAKEKLVGLAKVAAKAD